MLCKHRGRPRVVEKSAHQERVQDVHVDKALLQLLPSVQGRDARERPS